MEDDPVEVELVEALTDLSEEAAELPAAGLQQLAQIQEARAKRLRAVEKRLAGELDKDDVRLLRLRQTIDRSAALQALAAARARREALRPKIRPHEFAAYGTVRLQNGAPAPGLRVVLMERKGENEATFLGDAVTDRASGDFAITIPVREGRGTADEKAPELLLRVLSRRGETLIETEESFFARPGRVELFDITLPVTKVR